MRSFGFRWAKESWAEESKSLETSGLRECSKFLGGIGLEKAHKTTKLKVKNITTERAAKEREPDKTFTDFAELKRSQKCCERAEPRDPVILCE